MENIYRKIINTLNSNTPPSYEAFFSTLATATEVLDNEITSYRQKNDQENAGSVLDFTQDKDLPLIIIPDIHARTDFIKNILNYTITPELNFIKTAKQISVYQALKKNKIRIICVGDALHTEINTIERWKNIQIEFSKNIFTGPAATLEARDCFNTLFALLLLKISFPNNFHFLKGNHENIYNTTGDGDYSFRKIADEGNTLKRFIQNYYGEDILYLISYYEKSLPLISITKQCVISHAEPRTSYTKNELINAKQNPQIIEDLTWTNNDEAEENSVKNIIKNLLGTNSKAIYFAGHRPVIENFKKLHNGLFYQIHNPHKQNIVLIYKDKDFNPETDIIGVEK
jgi:hypothetical protein